MTESRPASASPAVPSVAALPGVDAGGSLQRIGSASTLFRLLGDTTGSAVCGIDGVCTVPEIDDENSSTGHTP